MSAETLYEIRGLELRFGDRHDAPSVVALPSLRIGPGERVALVGPNGSGKTSVLKLLNGLLAPSSGTVHFLGEAAAGSARLRRRSVYLHQHPWLFAGTVSYNVAFGCGGRGLPRAEVDRRVRDALDLVGLAGFGRRGHRALSGGEAQRVALARALATGADILLLDEPTASADADSARLVRAALAAAADRGATIVFSTHEDSLAREIATRRLRLERGAVVEDSGACP